MRPGSTRSNAIRSSFSRKLRAPDDFAYLDIQGDRLTTFETRYDSAARLFDWRFNRNDLNRSPDNLRRTNGRDLQLWQALSHTFAQLYC